MTLVNLQDMAAWVALTLMASAVLVGVWWIVDLLVERIADRRWARQMHNRQAFNDALDAIRDSGQPRSWTDQAAKGFNPETIEQRRRQQLAAVFQSGEPSRPRVVDVTRPGAA